MAGVAAVDHQCLPPAGRGVVAGPLEARLPGWAESLAALDGIRSRAAPKRHRVAGSRSMLRVRADYESEPGRLSHRESHRRHG